MSRTTSTMENAWRLLVTAGQHLPRVLLYGPPGTGKTHLAAKAGIKDGTPVYRVICTEDTPAAEMRGHFIPKGQEFVWHDGPAMMAYRNGGRLIVDEITRATDDALSFLLAVLDGHPITLPNGETVKPHPDMSVWATTNDTAESLTDALADRFVVKVECREVNPEALALLPDDLASMVSDSGSGISYRQAQEFTRLKELVGPHIASRLIWEGRATDVMYALDAGAKLKDRESAPMPDSEEVKCDCGMCTGDDE